MNPAHEAFVNTFFGQFYYNHMSVPKIIKNSKPFLHAWDGKRACAILSFDIDEDADVEALPRLLALLKKYHIKAGFAVTGMLVSSYPLAFKQVLKDGHELLNHTQTHPDSQFNENNFHELTPKEMLEEIQACHDTVKKLYKYEMKGFRVPHFGYQYTENIYSLLIKLGYEYSSSTLAIRTHTQGFPYKHSGKWELPMICCPKHPFCIFDTSHAFRSRFARHDPKEYITSFENVLDFGIKNSMFLNIYQDPQDIDKFDYEATLKMIAARKKDLWMPSYRELIKHLDRNKILVYHASKI